MNQNSTKTRPEAYKHLFMTEDHQPEPLTGMGSCLPLQYHHFPFHEQGDKDEWEFFVLIHRKGHENKTVAIYKWILIIINT